MSHILIATFPLAGHTRPALPLAHALVEAGYTVSWYASRTYQDKITALGATFHPYTHAIDFDQEKAVNDLFPQRAKLTGIAQLKHDLKHVFIEQAEYQFADLSAILDQSPADLLITDAALSAANYIKVNYQIPWVNLGITAFTLQSIDTAPFGLGLLPSQTPLGRLRNRFLNFTMRKIIMRDIETYVHDQLARHNLSTNFPTFDYNTHNCDLFLQLTIPEFEYPRSDLPPHVHFVGALLDLTTQTYDPPPWWPELDHDKPVILVTQGTLANDNFDELITPTIEALRHEEVLLIVTTGGRDLTPQQQANLPANTRVASFIPYNNLLPHVDIMITNGGYGGIQYALAHGVPLIGAGDTEDKPEHCTRIAWSGVGLNLRTGTPHPSQIKTAVHQILTDDSYRARAQAMKHAYRQRQPINDALKLINPLIKQSA
ncbi:MAG TPA: nucleotide disphospho-sugar-binding domain-containing protein [Anaerolineae bacterium]|nr:nucleotide disphospho-sugar-binding domain-containing protein [Anaerolineae bacterium]